MSIDIYTRVPACYRPNTEKNQQNKGITNSLALPIDKMLYIYVLCPHSEPQKKSVFNLNTLNAFTKKTSAPNVKLVLKIKIAQFSLK